LPSWRRAFATWTAPLSTACAPAASYDRCDAHALALCFELRADAAAPAAQNEAEVGQGLAAALDGTGIARSDVFITTKVCGAFLLRQHAASAAARCRRTHARRT
jgi:hypothetical protein